MIAETQERLDALLSIRKIAARSPDVLAELLRGLDTGRSTARGRPGGGARGEPRVEENPTIQRIRLFLESRGNQFTPTPTIVAETGLSRGAVGGALYSSGLFERRDHPSNRKVKLWRLKET